MSYNRRKFIKTSGSITSGLMLANMSGLSLLDACNKPGKIGDFGIQLYTLRDDMPKDPKGVLKQIAGFGYKQIESYEGPNGMFWGMSNIDFKKYMDELGMKIVDSHADINKDFEKKAAEASAIGMKYLICPWLGPQKSMDDYKKAADNFNKKGEICKSNGIRFAYHNHDYSFKPIDGQLPQDVMMNNTDASLVDFELDMYWVATAGEDIEAWLKKYKNRFRLCHVKDRSKTPGTNNSQNSVDLGTGSINWPSVLKTAKENGMKHFIVEQEYYAGTTPLNAVEVNAGYMKSLKI
ncbi:MAG: sugar phosphate isomerase/epimerase [Chitinophagaceae bacterium]|nr:sugar phosphate isomerase/epimerase [Chitinophagaceae bacterium]